MKKIDKLNLLINVQILENLSLNFESSIRSNKTNIPSAAIARNALLYQTLYRTSECNKPPRETNCIETVIKKLISVIMHTHILLSFIKFLFAAKYPATIYNPYEPPKKLTESNERHSNFIPAIFNSICNVGRKKSTAKIANIKKAKDFKEKVLTILATKGMPKYIPNIIGKYHICGVGTCFIHSNSLSMLSKVKY